MEKSMSIGMIPIYVAFIEAAGGKPRIKGAPYVLSCSYRCHSECGNIQSLRRRSKSINNDVIKMNVSALPVSDAAAETAGFGGIFACPKIADMHKEVLKRFTDVKMKYSLESDVKLTFDVRAAANSPVEVIYNISCYDVQDPEQRTELIMSVRNGLTDAINTYRFFQK